MLGLGDFVIPGFYLIFLSLFERKLHGTQTYFRVGLAGYLVGLTIAYVMVNLMRNLYEGQPALLYLVPGVLVPTLIVGGRRHELGLLWKGLARSHSVEEVSVEELGLLDEVEEPGSSESKDRSDDGDIV